MFGFATKFEKNTLIFWLHFPRSGSPLIPSSLSLTRLAPTLHLSQLNYWQLQLLLLTPKKFVTSHRDTVFISVHYSLFLGWWKKYCAILPVLSVVGRHRHLIWNVETKTKKKSDSFELCFSHEEMRLYLCQL